MEVSSRFRLASSCAALKDRSKLLYSCQSCCRFLTTNSLEPRWSKCLSARCVIPVNSLHQIPRQSRTKVKREPLSCSLEFPAVCSSGSAGSQRIQGDEERNFSCRSSAGSHSAGNGDRELWEGKTEWGQDTDLIVRVAKGVLTMVFAERLVNAFVTAVRFPLPSPVLLLVSISAFMATNSKYAAQLVEFMEPSISFFDKWMPLFFVPSITAISLAPVPQGLDMLRAVALLGGSYLFTLYGSGILAQKFQLSGRGRKSSFDGGYVSDDEKIKRLSDAARFWTRRAVQSGAKALASVALSSDSKAVSKIAAEAALAFEQVAEQIRPPPVLPELPEPTSILSTGLVFLLPALALSPSPTPQSLLPALLILSVGLFEYWKRYGPATVRKWVSPTVFAGSCVGVSLAVLGAVFLGGWRAGVVLYSQGAGLLLQMLIGPAVAALGYKVFTQRSVLLRSASEISLVSLLIVPCQLLFASLLARLLHASPLVTRSLLPAHTTLGLALETCQGLDASCGLIVAGVTLAGTIGISTAQSLLDTWKITDPAARGIAVGNASHTLGTSALASTEPQAAAVSGLSLALKGTLTVALLSIPPFRAFLINLAGA